jgi:hypothetical protein
MKRVVVAIALTLLLLAVAATAQLTDWSAPVNLGPVVNSAYLDSCVSVSKNGRSLFFFSTRYDLGKSGVWHLYVSQRASMDAPWGEPQEIKGFNEGYHATCPALSPDERRLFFASNRPDGCGANDIWVSIRHDPRDNFFWEPPAHIGCASDGYVNSPQGENVPTVFEDETGTEVLYFSSGRPGLGGADNWESRMRDDGTFGPATLVKELSTPYADAAAVRHDGLEVILSLTDAADSGNLWTATRESTEDPWPAPVILNGLNSAGWEGGRMSFSFNGRAFYFTSDRPGGYGGRDLYVSTRERLRK